MAFIGAYPVWSIIVIVVDVPGDLRTHGARRRAPSSTGDLGAEAQPDRDTDAQGRADHVVDPPLTCAVGLTGFEPATP